MDNTSPLLRTIGYHAAIGTGLGIAGILFLFKIYHQAGISSVAIFSFIFFSFVAFSGTLIAAFVGHATAKNSSGTLPSKSSGIANGIGSGVLGIIALSIFLIGLQSVTNGGNLTDSIGVGLYDFTVTAVYMIVPNGFVGGVATYYSNRSATPEMVSASRPSEMEGEQGASSEGE